MKHSVLFLLSFLASLVLSAQAPQGISYQSVVRDANQNLLRNQTVGVRISVLQTSPLGNLVYQETHLLSTNINGLLTLTIGQGSPSSGNFSQIDWANGPYYLRSEIDPSGSNNFSISSTVPLLSVPYALYAETAGTGQESDPVFAASPAAGISSSDTAHWNAKLSSESDPLFSSSLAAGISSSDTAHWNAKLSSENDPFFSSSLAAGISSSDTAHWNAKLSSESDPLFSSSLAAGISSSDTAHWNAKLSSESDPFFSSSLAAGISAYDTAQWNAKLDNELDGDPSNELQLLSLSADTLFLSQGNYVVLPAAFDGNYNSLSNAPQNLSAFNNDVGYLSQEGDADSTNELQILRRAGDSLFLEPGGQYILLPPGNLPGNNPGDMRYWDGSQWVNIPVGSPGQFLQISPGGLPQWSGAGYASLSTDSAQSLNPFQAIFYGRVSSNNGSAVTERGFVWSTQPGPTVADTFAALGSGTGNFADTIAQLNGGMTYYIRAYAINSAGTIYGNEISITMPSAYSLGSTGPAGGLVFYDKGSYSNGWRYLEATTTDQSFNAPFGCNNFNFPGAGRSAPGSGFENTQDILAACGGNIAARIAANHSQNGYSDWFLPSKDALREMRDELDAKGLGNFANDLYWSSTEASSLSAWAYTFITNGFIVNNKVVNYRVRAVRRF